MKQNTTTTDTNECSSSILRAARSCAHQKKTLRAHAAEPHGNPTTFNFLQLDLNIF